MFKYLKITRNISIKNGPGFLSVSLRFPVSHRAFNTHSEPLISSLKIIIFLKIELTPLDFWGHLTQTLKLTRKNLKNNLFLFQ